MAVIRMRADDSSGEMVVVKRWKVEKNENACILKEKWRTISEETKDMGRNFNDDGAKH